MSSIVGHSDFCHVYLCSAKMQQPGSGFLSVFASASRSVSGNSWEKHWMVVFDYGGDELYVCDADMDHAGHLTGRSAWKKKTIFEENCTDKKYQGRHEVPRARIENAMRKMSNSGGYHLTKNNCQKWAVAFLKELNIKVTACDLQAEQVVEELIVPTATVGAAALGALGVALASGNRRNKI